MHLVHSTKNLRLKNSVAFFFPSQSQFQWIVYRNGCQQFSSEMKYVKSHPVTSCLIYIALGVI